MEGIEIKFVEENLASRKLPPKLIADIKELFLDYGIFIAIENLYEKGSER
jgi:hypothetical protein